MSFMVLEIAIETKYFIKSNKNTFYDLTHSEITYWYLFRDLTYCRIDEFGDKLSRLSSFLNW